MSSVTDGTNNDKLGQVKSGKKYWSDWTPVAEANPFRFSTKFTDNETDLLYYGYRFYNASTGRWLSRDPIGERDVPNLYSFVRNAPMALVDPSGLQVVGPPDSGLPSWPTPPTTAPPAQKKQCCESRCDKLGDQEILSVEGFWQPGNRGINDPDAVEDMANKVDQLIKECDGQSAYIREPGLILVGKIKADSKVLLVRDYGVKLYTVLLYRECVKGHCGGASGWWRKHRGTCSPYHWQNAKHGPRLCKPKPEDVHHWQERENFFDEEAAQKAMPRCEQEHRNEFLHPERYVQF